MSTMKWIQYTELKQIKYHYMKYFKILKYNIFTNIVIIQLV